MSHLRLVKDGERRRKPPSRLRWWVLGAFAFMGALSAAMFGLWAIAVMLCLIFLIERMAGK